MEPTGREAELTRARTIDRLCDRFEAAWRAGKPQRLEDLVAAAPVELRRPLLRALVEIDLELHAGKGITPAEADYRKRFPDAGDSIAAAFAEFAAKRSGTDSVADAASRDTSVTRSSVRDPARGAGTPTGSFAAGASTAGGTPSPQKIGRFEILGVLGEGAFGKVYRARDPKLDREVALKVPLAGAFGSERDQERFLREARAAATIHHPNICPVFEVGQDGDTHYIVMAYVPGQSLADMLKARKTPLPPRQAVLIVRKLALALEAAHAGGVIHRDLKPGNILYDAQRKEMVLTDFGLARRLRKDEAQITQSGIVMGTPAYMAPEQARGDAKAVGPHSDVFSLGVILYELLTLQRPFTGSVAEVLGKVLHVDPDPPSLHRADLDPALESICLKALAKDPARRFASMKEFAGVLNDFLKGTAATEARSLTTSVAASGTGARAVADLVKELAQEHRAETAAAVEKAVRRARTPVWVWLAGSGALALALLFSLLFFVRSGPATIIIQVPLPEGISLKDTTLTFFLDRKEIAAADLERPIELAAGEHELLIRRGDRELRRMRFTVGMDGREVAVKVREVTGPPEAPKETPKTADFVPLFNGKDLTGWATRDGGKGNWRIQDGAITCSGPADYFYTERDDIGDFHLRAEVKINQEGNSGIYFRTGKPLKAIGDYEAQITNHPGQRFKTGSLYDKVLVGEGSIPPDTWFTYEIIASGASIRLLVNGKQTADFTETNPAKARKGHVALQHHDPQTRVWFRKIEISEPGKGPSAGADRPFAAWVHAKGGPLKVQVGDQELDIQPPAPLPKEPFRVTSFQLAAKPFLKDADLQPVSALTDLRRLDLHHNEQLGPDSLRPLRALKNVEEVVLFGDPGLTDAALEHLRHLSQLRVLQLQRTGITDKGVARLAGQFPLLETLHLTQNAVGDAALAAARTFPQLKILVLGTTDVTDKGLALLAGMKLTTLGITMTKITDDGLAHLRNMTTLETLRMRDDAVTDRGLAHLAGLTNLRQLDLRGTKVSRAGVEKLHAALPQCRIESDHGTFEPRADGVRSDAERPFAEWVHGIGGSLKILVSDRELAIQPPAPLPKEPFRVTFFKLAAKPILKDADLQPVSALTDLRILDLHHNEQLGPDSLQPLLALKNLEEIYLFGDPGLTDAAMEHVRHLSKLRVLHVQRTGITDKGVSRLAGRFPQLEMLDLAENAVGDEAVIHLPTFPKLRRLILGVTAVSDKGLPFLAETKLTLLDLNRTKITDAGLTHLQRLTSLNTLLMVDDAVTDRGLAHLAGLKNLGRLDLRGTKVSRAGVEKLHAALPQCRIESDHGTFEPK